MQVVTGYPPNFQAIAKAFPMALNPKVIFTYGDVVYTGDGAPTISPALKAHESVHSQRQREHASGVDGWWERYLADEPFRLEEELLAHRAEYRAFRGWTKDRNKVAQMLHQVATRLSSGLYGKMLSYQQARRFITVDVH